MSRSSPPASAAPRHRCDDDRPERKGDPDAGTSEPVGPPIPVTSRDATKLFLDRPCHRERPLHLPGVARRAGRAPGGSAGGGFAVAEAERLRVREEVHQLAARGPALGGLPELRLEQVGVVAQEELAQARVAEQEGRELFGEDVVGQDAVPGLGCQLRLGVRRRRDAAED